MASILPFDEINRLKLGLQKYFGEDGKIRSREAYEDMLDEMLDLFLLAYASGVESSNESLASNYSPSLDDALRTVDAEVVGKTWRERMREYYDNGGTIDDVARIVDTETHRDANAGAYEAAVAGGATEKVWHTMMDDRVRDTHFWLEGVSAPIDGEFYNYKGESTMYPGQWGIAEEDINCRCWLTYQ